MLSYSESRLEVAKARQKLSALLAQGYTQGGNFEHGRKVKILKAYILASIDELEMFGNVSTKCPMIHFDKAKRAKKDKDAGHSPKCSLTRCHETCTKA